MFYWVLPGFTGFYWVLLGLGGFYQVFLWFTGRYWVFLGLTWFWSLFYSTKVVDRARGRHHPPGVRRRGPSADGPGRPLHLVATRLRRLLSVWWRRLWRFFFPRFFFRFFFNIFFFVWCRQVHGRPTAADGQATRVAAALPVRIRSQVSQTR